MKTKEFKDIISQSTAKTNRLILNTIEYSCIPFNSWFETHSRLKNKKLIIRNIPVDYQLLVFVYMLQWDNRRSRYPHYIFCRKKTAITRWRFSCR